MRTLIFMGLALLLGCAGNEHEQVSPETDSNASFEAGGRLLGTVYGGSDDCRGDTIALIVKRDTDCNTVSNAGDRAWSIKMRGQCININDTNVATACRQIQTEVAGDAVFGTTDSCDGIALFSVSARTDCEALKNPSAKAWSIKIGGRCININDTDARRACLLVMAELADNGSGGHCP